MTFRPQRYVGLCLLLLVFSVVADWCRVNCLPPPGYGAVEDRRTSRMPVAVRETVEEQSAGSEGSWVKECVEGGSWVYELHIFKDRKWSIIRITLNGNVIQSRAQKPKPGDTVEAGG